MKKIFSVILISLFCISVCSCSNTASNTPQNVVNSNQKTEHTYYRIIINDQNKFIVKFYEKDFQRILGEYTNLQSALNELVDRYNITQENEDLYKICQIIHYNGCFNIGDILMIEYYSKFFEEIERDKSFDKKTKEMQVTFARDLTGALYSYGKQIESVDFFHKYLATIKDDNKKVKFNIDCFDNYFNYAQEASNDFLVALLKTEKELEKNCYNKVNNQYKIKINYRLSICYQKLGDIKMAKEYDQRARQIIINWVNETSQK